MFLPMFGSISEYVDCINGWLYFVSCVVPTWTATSCTDIDMLLVVPSAESISFHSFR